MNPGQEEKTSTPSTIEEWETAWQEMLDRDNRRRVDLRSSGEAAGMAEHRILDALALVDETAETYRSIFQSAWMLWACGQKLLLRRPRFGRVRKARYESRRKELQAVIDRLKVKVIAFNDCAGGPQ